MRLFLVRFVDFVFRGLVGVDVSWLKESEGYIYIYPTYE